MAKVLVIGGGGREHALVWALNKSPQVDEVYVAPGNGGTSAHNVRLKADDFDALIAFARENSVDLTVVGPEVPLANGIVDAFQAAGLRIFGPTQAAAQIEASKAFAKDLMTQQGIPTGAYFVTDDLTAARRYLEEYRGAVVIKADGLAAGKGVIVCDTREEAGMALHQIMSDRAFGDAGETVLIEERHQGHEISLMAFCDGQTVRPMLPARDHKRALDGDKGLNTGGMGAFAPVPDISSEWVHEIVQTVLQPAVDGMAALGTPYVGVLYAGLMLTDNGVRVLEFNCRFGDPETQAVLPLLDSDLYTVLNACIDGRLAETRIRWRDGSAAAVVLASGGYPGSYVKGHAISGLNTIAERDDVVVFHAGTEAKGDQIVTAGGRVMAVTGLGDSLNAALNAAYAAVQDLCFDDMHYRKDIGRTQTES